MMRGFVFDAGDPSVGIFGGDWVHEECPTPLFQAGPNASEMEVLDLQLAVVRVNDMTVRTYHLLTCTDCVQQVIVTEDDFSPSDEYEARFSREVEAVSGVELHGYLGAF